MSARSAGGGTRHCAQFIFGIAGRPHPVPTLPCRRERDKRQSCSHCECRHCEERSDEAIQSSLRGFLDCFAALAITVNIAAILRRVKRSEPTIRAASTAPNGPAQGSALPTLRL